MLKIICALMLIGVVTGRVNQPYVIARMREFVEQECTAYGAQEQVDKVMEGMLKFLGRIDNMIDGESLARFELVQDPEFPNELINFVKTTCKNQSQINTCFDNMLDVLDLCSDPQERGKTYIAKQSVAKMTDMFCEDNSKIFSEFMTDGAYPCIKEQLSPILACTNKIQSLHNYKTLTTAEACLELDEVTRCVMKPLQTCPNPSTADFVAALFRAISKGSFCTDQAEKDNKIDVNAL